MTIYTVSPSGRVNNPFPDIGGSRRLCSEQDVAVCRISVSLHKFQGNKGLDNIRLLLV